MGTGFFFSRLQVGALKLRRRVSSGVTTSRKCEVLDKELSPDVEKRMVLQ